MIILFAEMTKPYVLKVGGYILCKEIGRSLIAQMPERTGYPLLKELRIVPHTEHILVIVRFDNQIVSFKNISCSRIGYVSQVSDEA